MELKATSIGKKLAQHPYHRARMLSAGVEVSGDKHQYMIPFNQLLKVECKQGVVWGELEFLLPEKQVVRLHGTEWQETQKFYHYLMQHWQAWSLQMAEVSQQVLNDLQQLILSVIQRDEWLKKQETIQLQQVIQRKLAALPLPEQRFPEFPACYSLWQFCQKWRYAPDQQRIARNQQWVADTESRYQQFFATLESSPLNRSQRQAVLNDEKSVLVLAGAGSGKTSVMVAKAAWLLERKLAKPEQILLLAFGHDAAQQLNQRMVNSVGESFVTAKTFHVLALEIIRQATHKAPVVSQLETDRQKRHQLLTDSWAEQCEQKKAAANGWQQLLGQDLGWEIDGERFWDNPKLRMRLAGHLERWIGLMRADGASQSAMIDSAPEEIRPHFAKRIKLMAPLLKAWKNALKQEGAVDFTGLIQQAIGLLEKKRFIGPWKYILVDEFQDISPLRSRMLSLLREQNAQVHLFAVGDDWQSIYRFTGAELKLTTEFHQTFGEGATCYLDMIYRFNQRISDISGQFILKNPVQLNKSLNSLHKGSKKSVILLADDQLEILLNKMSGYVTTEETILILSRYHHLRPQVMEKAATRWPNLQIECMTIHASKGCQADYVIVTGLSDGEEGFPARRDETVIEQGLLPQTEAFADAEERRLAYVAMTRAKQQLWLLFDRQRPSDFVQELNSIGVPIASKP